VAGSSLSKTTSKLNLSRRQTELFQQIILVGNRMSDLLSALEDKISLPKNSGKLSRSWQDLMIRLAKMLI
jgi:hypothetical protein